MTTCSVYWIKAAHHSDFMTEGYIGVARDVSKRWKYGHFGSQKNNRHDNPKFSNAIAKHGWDSLVKEVLVVASENYCYDLEFKIRPLENIGWNLAVGGGKPPVSKYRGPDYVSPLKGVSRPTPWLVGRTDHAPSREACSAGGKMAKGRKHSPEHLAKRMESRKLTRIAKGQIKKLIVNGVAYDGSTIASEAIGVSAVTLRYWANGKGKPSERYAHIVECRWAE